VQLGDFFKNAATCQPVNPRPVTFAAIARGKILPGGEKNPTGGHHRAHITAAFVFVSGEETATARLDARRALRERCVDEKKMSLPYTDDDFNMEYLYHLLWRALCEWEPEEKKVGGRIFPSVSTLQELVILPEATRIMDLYNAYVRDEHPEVLDKATFRDAAG
jgi:hypothetical protein